MVESFVVKTVDSTKGVWRQCNHCRINKKRKDWEVKKALGNEFLECGCSKNKAVCEQLLMDRGIIGKELENKDLKTLADKEWFKLDHVMGNLFGFNTNWLMDKEVMIAGLEAKLAQLKE
jgi:hypothetical protein